MKNMNQNLLMVAIFVRNEFIANEIISFYLNSSLDYIHRPRSADGASDSVCRRPMLLAEKLSNQINMMDSDVREC